MKQIVKALSQMNVMQKVHEVIRKKATVKDGIIYNQAGRKIGRYNTSKGYGWISFFEYQALRKSPDISVANNDIPDFDESTLD